jgi:hypothetical protein
MDSGRLTEPHDCEAAPHVGGVEPVIPPRAAPGGPGSAESDRGGGETRTPSLLPECCLVTIALGR